MTIELSAAIEARLQKLLEAGKFQSAEHFVAYSIGAYRDQDELFTDEGFTERVKVALAEAQDDINKGRVRKFTKANHHELYEDVIRRGEESAKAGNELSD